MPPCHGCGGCGDGDVEVLSLFFYVRDGTKCHKRDSFNACSKAVTTNEGVLLKAMILMVTSKISLSLSLQLEQSCIRLLVTTQHFCLGKHCPSFISLCD